MGGSSPARIKEFCKAVAQGSHDGLLSRRQAKTLMGQAKSGELQAAMKGLQTIMSRQGEA